MKRPQLPWARLLGEATLIIVSVYLAIVLEGMSQDREAEQAARTALGQMLEEMRADSADLDEIRAEQQTRDRQYQALIEWLANPETMPLDAFSSAIDPVFFSNRTLYPRRSAWTTMVAAGQLGRLDAPVLVTQLGNFYESVNARVIDNGKNYDENLNAIARTSVNQLWDAINGRLLTADEQQLTMFRNQLRYLHIGWNLWYLDLLNDYEHKLDGLMLEIELYLEENKPGSSIPETGRG